MISYCKDIDITSVSFIEKAIMDCLLNRDRRDYYRADIQRIIQEYGTIDKMARQMSNDIKRRDLNLPPVIDDQRIDRCNGKLREIKIEDIWQQFYDYVASNALKPALARLGYYQCGCIEGKGQIWGVQMIYGFVQNYRFAIHGDIRKCYPSIPQKKLFAFLRKFVRNKPLIWLIETLVTHTTDKGISIGSRLSITLCQLYLSQVYHHMQGVYKERRGKRIKLAKKILIFMDDIYLFGNDARDLRKAQKEGCRYCAEELGIEIKPTWTLVDCEHGTLDAMGFRINRKYIKMRRINYLRTKRSLRRFKKRPNPKTAATLMTRKTNIKYSNSYRFRKKYKWKQISKRARRIISNESKVQNKTGDGNGNTRWQYSLLPDRAQRGGSADGRPGDGNNTDGMGV